MFGPDIIKDILESGPLHTYSTRPSPFIRLECHWEDVSIGSAKKEEDAGKDDKGT